MAGSDPRFNATTFRNGIRFAMKMGSPTATQDKVTFRWNPERTYNPEDPTAAPYDWTASPTSETLHADVVVDNVAVEFTARPAASKDTHIGEFDSTIAVLTMLDDDYEPVRTANQVLLGGNIYDVRFVEPPVGLFDVTVYRIHCEARDES